MERRPYDTQSSGTQREELKEEVADIEEGSNEDSFLHANRQVTKAEKISKRRITISLAVLFY